MRKLIQRLRRIKVPSFQPPQAIYRFEPKRSDADYLKQDFEKIGQDFQKVMGGVKDNKF